MGQLDVPVAQCEVPVEQSAAPVAFLEVPEAAYCRGEWNYRGLQIQESASKII